MTLPALQDWASTRTALHQAAQVIGAFRAAVVDPEPNFVHQGLRIVPDGLTTGALPGLGELVLDFNTLAVLFYPYETEPVGFSLFQHNQLSLLETLTTTLAELGYAVMPRRDTVDGASAVFDLNAGAAASYGRVLGWVGSVLEKFRASLPGQKSPLVVWPDSFDASFLWFAADTASETAPHLRFGFSPYSTGLERPYFYACARPIPDGLTQIVLPQPAYWHTEGWTGAVIAYDQVVGTDAPDAGVERILHEIYTAAAPRLG